MTFMTSVDSVVIPVTFEYRENLPVFFAEWDVKANIPYEKRSKVIEAAEKKALIQLAGKNLPLSDWALAVLEIASVLLILVRLSGDGVIRIPGQSPEVIQFFTFTGELKAYRMSDIMMYAPESHYLQPTESLFQLAAEIVNVNLLKDAHEKEKEHLQAFYDTLIAPLKEIPIEDATREDIKTAMMYADWYKDLYGRFPS